MKALYKPFGIIFGIVGGILARKAFTKIWGEIKGEDPPAPLIKEYSWSDLLLAGAVQGMVYQVVRYTIARLGAQGYENLTGIWPGQHVAEPE